MRRTRFPLAQFWMQAVLTLSTAPNNNQFLQRSEIVLEVQIRQDLVDYRRCTSAACKNNSDIAAAVTACLCCHLLNNKRMTQQLNCSYFQSKICQLQCVCKLMPTVEAATGPAAVASTPAVPAGGLWERLLTNCCAAMCPPFRVQTYTYVLSKLWQMGLTSLPNPCSLL